MTRMIIELLIALSLFGSYVVVRSDEANTTVIIAPGSDLQDYICSKTLQSNITIVLEGGEHRISSQQSCNIVNNGSITITENLDSAKRTIVRCESKTRELAFVSVQTLIMERIVFINCGIQLVSIGNTFIVNCTFQNSTSRAIWLNSNIYSASLFSNTLTGDVSITGSTFQSNSAGDDDGGAVMLDGHIGNVIITDCTFHNNSAGVYGGAVVFRALGGYVSITGCTFQSNRAGGSGGGGAVALYSSKVDVSITGSTFQSNSADWYGGAVMLDATEGKVSITDCTFQNNNAVEGGGAVHLSSLISNVDITNCTFQNNHAGEHGGGVDAIKMDGLTCNVSIRGCTFQNNSAGDGGGLNYPCTLTSNGMFCAFNMDRYQCGGAIYTTMSYNMFSNLLITNNIAEAGAAVCANRNQITNDLIPPDTEIIQLILQDVVVKDHHCSYGLCAGAVYFIEVDLVIIGTTTTGSHFSYNFPQGAIQGEGGTLTLRGYITFEHNTGVNGGAISLTNNVPLYFYLNCTVRFVSNLATGYGGAIYNNGKVIKHSTFPCILRIFSPYTQDKVYCDRSASITFIDNHAILGGHAVYAKPIYDCTSCFDVPNGLYTFGDTVIYDFLRLDSVSITPLHEDVNDTQVLSFPEHVDYCGCNDPNLCNGTTPIITTYPGRTVKLNITSVDQRNNLSPSVVYTQVDTGDINIMIGPRQKAQWIGTVCGQIEYQIFGPENATLTLRLSNDPNSFQTVINVNLLPCEPGFVLITNSSTSMMKCDCSPFLTSLGVVCDTSDGTVTRNKTNWIGVYNNTLPALAQTCPLDYCNSTIKKLSLARPGYLCNGGRTGIICGHCHGNLSVIFGSSKCQECSEIWLTTLVMFAVLGVFLVAALFFLNLTITQGTLYGLIFYANIIQVNSTIFFNQSILNPLQVIVSLVNLDLGLPMCFYNGMDDADKAGLQFVFPAYLLILTMATILVCHYCLQRSPTTSTSFFLHKLSTIIGERAVGVLSTLIYLSYAKMLRTVIDILTYSTVHLPSGDMYVWYYDGNLEYLHGKHIALFVVAMATCTLFLLPYTFALTFIPIIEQYSEHNRLFNYLHKKVNQIKPMNDAHYAPYKGEWRWWLGARLWLLVVMYSLNPVYNSDRPSLLLTIQATMVILFAIAQASIKPFGQSHQKTHQPTNFYNQLHNCLDMLYLLNYTALAMSMSYILDQSSDQTHSAMVTVGFLVGLFVVMLMVTVLYHLIVVILKTCKMYDRTREKFNGLFEKKQYEPMVPIELDDPTNSIVGTTSVTVYCGLREPLLED